MFRVVSARRARVERLLFVSMLLAGGLAWGRVAVTRADRLPLSVSAQAVERADEQGEGEWRALSRALSSLTIPAAPRSGSGGG